MQRLHLSPTRWVWLSIVMESLKAYNMTMEEEEETKEEEGTVPTNPSRRPSSPLSEIASPKNQRPKTLRNLGLNRIDVQQTLIASAPSGGAQASLQGAWRSAPLERAPRHELSAATGAQSP
ncbi:hypothetical protein LR48_Vigan02g073500 [Vigna angularis]|uniref:Uncharacterized protein n=1 Tax=Phaseolus angularis TaxID=3914 RepID=A0A0L9TVK8_PHAAN|nr:hypothetical protein LR48_Vigan02g073500 [Vigna angularis]